MGLCLAALGLRKKAAGALATALRKQKVLPQLTRALGLLWAALLQLWKTLGLWLAALRASRRALGLLQAALPLMLAVLLMALLGLMLRAVAKRPWGLLLAALVPPGQGCCLQDSDY